MRKVGIGEEQILEAVVVEIKHACAPAGELLRRLLQRRPDGVVFEERGRAQVAK